MEQVTDDSATQYDATQIEGQQVIRSQWKWLGENTQRTLVESGFYSEHGKRLNDEFNPRLPRQHECDRLEQALGALKSCARATLPNRSDKGALIPPQTLTSDVMLSVEEVLCVPAWQDPVFLRLALHAVCRHQMANALSVVGPPKKFSAPAGCLTAILRLALILAMPPALAIGLAAAVQQDAGSAAFAFYVLGAGVMACMGGAKVGVSKPDPFEQAYDQWSFFEFDRAVGASGLGALERLRKMAAEGVKVPPIAFDLADMLRARMGASAH